MSEPRAAAARGAPVPAPGGNRFRHAVDNVHVDCSDDMPATTTLEGRIIAVSHGATRRASTLQYGGGDGRFKVFGQNETHNGGAVFRPIAAARVPRQPELGELDPQLALRGDCVARRAGRSDKSLQGADLAPGLSPAARNLRCSGRGTPAVNPLGRWVSPIRGRPAPGDRRAAAPDGLAIRCPRLPEHQHGCAIIV